MAADLRAFERCGVHGAVVVATQTVQDTRGVRQVAPIHTDLLTAQIEALLDDLRVDAVKVGLIASPDHAAALARLLPRFDAPIIVDPVLRASSGDDLASAARDALLTHLLPVATLATPNAAEFAALGALPCLALVTGGDAPGALVTDALWPPRAERPSLRWFSRRLPEPGASAGWRGTGCALSSAIAAALAHGRTVPAAIAIARRHVRAWITAAQPVGRGRWVL